VTVVEARANATLMRVFLFKKNPFDENNGIEKGRYERRCTVQPGPHPGVKAKRDFLIIGME